ncbi:MAG: hypothetical protein IJO16_05935 [Clostridia bacterium]|nr:hypothetical protein [Clostridia bacterium]MBQ7092983.1 hypothetical protein [Clostridia bacterium]
MAAGASGGAGGTGSPSSGGSDGAPGSSSGTNTIESIKTWITRINPHYGNPFFPKSSVNCGACALAVERRLSGDDINATAGLKNIGTDAGMEQATGKKCVYMDVKDIEAILKMRGKGSHLIVGINRRLPDGTAISGHWFNVFYDGNEIYTVEGQSGEIYEWPHDYGYISEWCALV